MNKLKKLIAVAITAAMLMPIMPVMADNPESPEPSEAPATSSVNTDINKSAEEAEKTEETEGSEITEPEATEIPKVDEEKISEADSAEDADAELTKEQEAPAEIFGEPVFGESQNISMGNSSSYPYTESPVPEGEYIPDTYGYPIQGDPYNTKQVKKGIEYSMSSNHLNDPYWLRDADFFGQWNEAKGTWTKAPKLNYAEFPNMSRVEDAAKSGDYEMAKLAYYNYYVNKEASMNRNKVTSSAKKDRITADLLCKNFMYNGNSGITPIDIMNIGNTPEYNNIDISETVTKYLGIREYLVFWVLATDKNGDWVDFDSKEGANRPYLQLKVDGADKIIYPTADTNIKAGSNKSTVYGSDTALTAREDEFGVTSYSHDGVSDKTHIHVNENTSRIYMKFDVSSLKEGDTINAATLNMYGSNQVAGQEKEVIVFYSDDSSWQEDKLTYSSATAQVIYSYDQAKSWWWNQPISAGYRYQEELLRFNTWFDKLVKLYNYTGDEKYAYTAIRQFLDYINVRGDDICWLKSLDVAVRTQAMPGLMMQLLDSKYMSPEVFTAFMKWCYVQGTGAKKFTRNGNWGTSESLGLYNLVINYPEFTDADEWLARVRKRYADLSTEMTKSDYVCTELSLGYTDYTLTTLIDARDVAIELGMFNDEYTPYTQTTLDNIEHLGLFMYWSSMPGVSDNQVGDGYSHRGNFKSRLENLGNWFNNKQLLYGATDGDKGEEPPFTSKLFPVGLKAVMRTNWSDKAMYLFTDADGGVGNHAHPDDNSIVVAAHGQYLLVDPLYGTYSASAAKTWLTSSIAHNQVVMNGKNQGKGGESHVGKIPRWETNNSYDFVTTDTPSVPDASSYKRSVFFQRGKLFLVNDYLTPSVSGNNKYVQAWHYLPEAGISMDNDTKTVTTDFTGANIQVVPIGAEKFTRAENVKGLYSESQGSVSDAMYTEYEKRGAGNMVFNTLLLPQSANEEFEVSVGELAIEGMSELDASAYEFYIEEKNSGKISRYQYYLLHNTSKKQTVTIDTISTDASMMFVEMDMSGNVKYIAVQDAGKLSKGDTEIFMSDSLIDEFSVSWSGENMSVDSSCIDKNWLKSNNVKIYNNRKTVSEVKVNGEVTTAASNGNYIYFGTTPTAGPVPTATPVPTKTPATHGGGSGGGGGSVNPPIVTPTLVPTAKPTTDPDATPSPTSSPMEMNDSLKAELENHWSKKEVTALFEKGIVKGQTENSFGLENTISRAEFVVLMVRAIGIEPSEYKGGFDDVSGDDWYAGYIQAAYDRGIFEGADGKANPTGSITREEMAKMLAAVIIDDGAAKAGFSDESEISGWAKDSVDKVVAKGLMNGREDGTFDPKSNTKRCEAFVVIYRLIQ